MKKRILSALLALVMVLALLPATAFAVDWTTDSTPTSPEGQKYQVSDTNPEQKDYYVKDANGKVTSTVTVTRCNASNPLTGQVYGTWYWQKNKGTDAKAPQYVAVNTGIVAGTSGSGQWYASVEDYSTAVTGGGEKVRGAFTALGTAAINLSAYKDTSLTLAIANDTASLTIPTTLTSLNVTGKFQDTPAGVMNQGHVGAISVDRSTQVTGGTNSGLNITAENVNIDSINLTGRANTLRLTDCTVGAITMDGATITTVGGATPNSWGAQTINATRTTTGAITIANSNGGGVTLQDSTVGGAIGFTSDGGTIQVGGASTTDLITVTPRTVNGSYAQVRITGGTVAGVTQGQVANNDKVLNVTVTGTGTQFGTITAEVNGNVSITDADGAAVKVDKGTVSIAGSGVQITGNVTLAAKAPTTLRMSASNSTFGGIVGNSNLTISAWNGARQRDGGNNYGTLDLSTYDGGKITGGTFAKTNATAFGNATAKAWLDVKNLQFFVDNGANYDLYTKTELARAISDIGTAQAIQPNKIVVLGQAGGHNLVLKNGQNELAKIVYSATTPLILPDKINGMVISQWFAVDNRNIILPAGKEEGVPALAGDLTLNCTTTSAAVNKITKATVAVANTPGDIVNNQNVTVTLNGNNIHVSGAVTSAAGGIATIKVDLDTDVVDDQGEYITLEGVVIDYYVDSKRVAFNAIQPETVNHVGIIVQNGQLVLNNGTGERYTVTASLTEPASRLGIVTEANVGQGIVVTFGGKLSSWSAKQKEELTDKLAGTGTSFLYGNNQAMQQAINAAQATITANNTVTGWITNAKNTIWRQGFKSPDTTQNIHYGYVDKMAPHTGAYNSASADGAAIEAAFSNAYIVPYLVVNVTDYDPAGGMTVTLTPYYRVDVSAGTYDSDMAYTVQQGRALTLTGGMTNEPVKVKFNLGAAFETQFMHQDGKYVYAGTQANGWKITHLGANGTLGTMVINGKDGLVTIEDTAVTGGPAAIDNRAPALTALACKYDTLQAAIDDTVRGATIQTSGGVTGITAETMDTVKIDGQYTGSCAVNMTGMSRKVYLVAEGQQDVTTNGKDVSLQTAGGHRYVMELKQDAVAAGSVAIAVNGAENGTAVASATIAKVGQTVTITATPKAGFSTLGMTAVGNGNVTVPVTGSGNSWSFKVPENVTSITVTPRFGVAGQATVSVNNNTNGSAIVAGNANTVAQGSTVTVYTTPKTGYRATGVSVRFSNGTTVNATNTGTNTWSFSVPANVTTVSITPSFSVDTGLPFLDVAATEYYLPYVKFVYNHGMMKGDGNDYTFNGNGRITRGQIVTILYRLQGSPVVALNTSFKDVPANEYYAYPVAWAAASGVVNGRNTTTFDPNAAITRQELAAILYRYNNFRGLSSGNLSNLSQFTDRGYVDNYALTPMQWAVGNGIITGTNPNTLSPNGTATRYQAATMLTRYCQTFLKMV